MPIPSKEQSEPTKINTCSLQNVHYRRDNFLKSGCLFFLAVDAAISLADNERENDFLT